MQKFNTTSLPVLRNVVILSKNPITGTKMLLILGSLNLVKINIPKHYDFLKTQDMLQPIPNTYASLIHFPYWHRFIFKIDASANCGFLKQLYIKGRVYRFILNNKTNNLELELGYTDSVLYTIPTGFSMRIYKKYRLLIVGYDKHTVSLVASLLKSLRPANVYRGTGIRYWRERLHRKPWKKTQQ